MGKQRTERRLYRQEKKTVLQAGVPAFLFSFALQVFLNRFVTTVRSLPDEMGAIYLAAARAGYDWSYVMTTSNRYYGSIMFPLLYPWFRLVRNPYTLYQFLLGTGTLLRSLPALYAADLLGRRCRSMRPGSVFLLSALSVFITPTRSVNIDNEPALIFLCWTVFYLLLRLQDLYGPGETEETAGKGSSSGKETAGTAGKGSSSGTAAAKATGKLFSSGLEKKERGSLSAEAKGQGREKWVLSIALGLVLAVSVLAHTRAIIFLITAVLALAAGRLLWGHWFVHLPSLAGSCAAGMAVCAGIVGHWKEVLYDASARASSGEHLMNTGGALAGGVARGVGRFGGQYGIRAFLDLLSGNTFIIFVFSGGVILAGLFYTAALFAGAAGSAVKMRRTGEKAKRIPGAAGTAAGRRGSGERGKPAQGGAGAAQTEKGADSLYPLLFGFLGIAGIVAGLCLTWIGAAIRLHTNGSAVSHGHFYLRYYGMYFGPFFLALSMSLAGERRRLRGTLLPMQVFFVTAAAGAASFCFSRFSFLQDSIAKARDSDAFYNFAPLSFSFQKYPMQVQDGAYYLKNLLAAAAVFCLLYFLVSRMKRRAACLLLLAFLLYQHIYIVYYWDAPITSKDHFAASSDGIYRLWQAHEGLFESGDTLYQTEESVAKYTTQFAMKELRVVTEAPPDDEENAMVLIAEPEKLEEYGIDPAGYRMLRIDDNEILLVRGSRFRDRFAREGLTLLPCVFDEEE